MQPLANVVTTFMRPLDSHGGIIEELKFDGEIAQDVLHNFCCLRNRLFIPVSCFYELYKTDYGKKIGITGLVRDMVSLMLGQVSRMMERVFKLTVSAGCRQVFCVHSRS
jgi:hypothetical protein